jgi:ubiquitin-protein ligase
MSRAKRIEEERQEFIQYKKCISCDGDPKPDDTVWNITMEGPKDSPYMGGKFKIRITFPDAYPNKPPKFEFLTPIIHINIDGNTICLGSLKESETYNSNSTILDMLSQIFMMLTSPNEQSAYPKYFDLYVNNYAEYLDKAREKTREFAI